jgi:hypothetical protein
MTAGGRPAQGGRAAGDEMGGMGTLRARARSVFVVAGVMLAVLAATGCTHQRAAPLQVSAQSCARFSISALRHHVTVTSLPAACKGLTRAQLTNAADAAAEAMAGTMHGKRLMRARMRELSPLIPRLPHTRLAQRSQTLSMPGTSQASGTSLGIAALVSWLITVGLGLSMMARWIAGGGRRGGRAGAAGSRLGMNLAHLGLAVAGLVTWVMYLVTGLAGLAWMACVLVLPVAGLGMSLLFLRLPERSLAATAVPAAQAVPIAVGAAPAQAAPEPPSARHPPGLLVAAHVAFAMATILYTLLAAVGSG